MTNIPQVLHEIRDGHGLTFARVARQYGKNPATIFRWHDDGVKDSEGTRHYLEACRIGATLTTSAPAVERFTLALSEPCHESVPAPRSPSKRKAASDRASKQLAAMGA